jgi:hypothetical protein
VLIPYPSSTFVASWLRGTGSGRQPRPVRVDWITDDRRDHAAVTQKPFDAHGLYDGQGGFVEPDATIEAHLAKIESAAAVTIRKFTAKKIGEGGFIPPEIARFLAWQAARRRVGWSSCNSGPMSRGLILNTKR